MNSAIKFEVIFNDQTPNSYITKIQKNIDHL